MKVESRNILINALSAQDGGGVTYVRNLLEFISRNNRQERYYVIVDKSNKLKFDTFNQDNITLVEAHYSNNFLARYLWELIHIKSLIKTNRITHYYCPGGIISPFKISDVVNITAFRNMMPFYQLGFEKYTLMERFRLKLLQKLFIISFKSADKLVFISNYAQNIIRDYIPDINNKSVVIPHGVNEIFRLPTKEASFVDYNLPDNYVLYVSTVTVYKHQAELIEAIYLKKSNGESFNPVVLVGSIGSQFGKNVLKKIATYGLEKDVIYLGKVAYNDLPNLYRNARSVIFASSCENCPNILLESMSMRKLIFCSKFMPMPEFGKQSVIYFNPTIVDEFVRILTLEYDFNSFEKIEFENMAYEQSLQYQFTTSLKDTLAFILE
ncbi:glycosyltransferase family 1 protein [Cytophagales bacterium LB-30]|uniref:Glycosyltransferase family 1 protein n=1 Tax=Shiella aurantiaca TaxID=3058365 RepID=A0ABT8F3Q4_9BACT|nr:glycosyltransferase family 1 protein [Shiella aurantiaca]MDN4164631.1 glycosyltransferase family 1 protein [Shiella aurantiaca]